MTMLFQNLTKRFEKSSFDDYEGMIQRMKLTSKETLETLHKNYHEPSTQNWSIIERSKELKNQ